MRRQQPIEQRLLAQIRVAHSGNVASEKKPDGHRAGDKKEPPLANRYNVAPRNKHTLAGPDQPTLVVAWVGIFWHASAHKRRPVFRRRAPELIAIAEANDPCGLLKSGMGHSLQRYAGGEEQPGCRKKWLRTHGVRPNCPERIGLGSPMAKGVLTTTAPTRPVKCTVGVTVPWIWASTPRAWPRAWCPCSRDNASTTRRCRSARCVCASPSCRSDSLGRAPLAR